MDNPKTRPVLSTAKVSQRTPVEIEFVDFRPKNTFRFTALGFRVCKELLQKEYGRSGITFPIVLLAKPRNDPNRPRINFSHFRNLVILFFDIDLIDANDIDPKDARFQLISQMIQRSPQILSHTHTAGIQYNISLSTVLGPPFVGQRFMRRTHVQVRSLKVAADLFACGSSESDFMLASVQRGNVTEFDDSPYLLHLQSARRNLERRSDLVEMRGLLSEFPHVVKHQQKSAIIFSLALVGVT
jgi:hypothetical protein